MASSMHARIYGPLPSCGKRSTLHGPHLSAPSSLREARPSDASQAVRADSHPASLSRTPSPVTLAPPTSTPPRARPECSCASTVLKLLVQGRYEACVRLTSDRIASALTHAGRRRSTAAGVLYRGDGRAPSRPTSTPPPPGHDTVCTLLHGSLCALLALGCRAAARGLLELWELYDAAHAPERDPAQAPVTVVGAFCRAAYLVHTATLGTGHSDRVHEAVIACARAIELLAAHGARQAQRRVVLGEAAMNTAQVMANPAGSASTDARTCRLSQLLSSDARVAEDVQPLLLDLCVRVLRCTRCATLPEREPGALRSVWAWLRAELPSASRAGRLPAGTWCLWQLCEADVLYRKRRHPASAGASDIAFREVMQCLSTAAREVQAQLSPGSSTTEAVSPVEQKPMAYATLREADALASRFTASPLVSAIVRARQAAAAAAASSTRVAAGAAAVTAGLSATQRTHAFAAGASDEAALHRRTRLLCDGLRLALASFALNVCESVSCGRLLPTTRLHLDECTLLMAMVEPRSRRSGSGGEDGDVLVDATPVLIRAQATADVLQGLAHIAQQQHSLGCISFHTEEDLYAVGCQVADETLTSLTAAVRAHESGRAGLEGLGAVRLLPVLAELAAEVGEARARLANAARRPVRDAVQDLRTSLAWRLLGATWARQGPASVPRRVHAGEPVAVGKPQESYPATDGVPLLEECLALVDNFTEATARALLATDAIRVVGGVLAYADGLHHLKHRSLSPPGATAASVLRSTAQAVEAAVAQPSRGLAHERQNGSHDAQPLGTEDAAAMLAMLRAALARVLVDDMPAHRIIISGRVRRSGGGAASHTDSAAEAAALCTAVLADTPQAAGSPWQVPAPIPGLRLCAPAVGFIFVAGEARVLAHQCLAELTGGLHHPQAIEHLRLALLERRRWLGEGHESVAAAYVDLGGALLHGCGRGRWSHAAREAHACAVAAMAILTTRARRYGVARPSTASAGEVPSGVVQALAGCPVYEQASTLLARAARAVKLGGGARVSVV